MKVHAIASPNQSRTGEILVRNTQFPDEKTNEILLEKNKLQIFIHFAKMDQKGILIPYFIDSKSKNIMHEANVKIENYLSMNKDVRIIFTSVSHLEIAITKHETYTLIKKLDNLDSNNIREYINKLYPNSIINQKNMKFLKSYLHKIKQNKMEPYNYYKIQSLVGKIALHVIVERNDETGDIISSNISDPLLITGLNPNKWKNIKWGEKNKRKFGTPIISEKIIIP